MRNSFHSDNFICLINATSQALTISNAPPQLPASITLPAVPKGASKKLYPSNFLHLSNRKDLYDKLEIYKKPVKGVGFLNKVPATSDLYECLLKDGAATENMYWLDVPAEKEDTA